MRSKNILIVGLVGLLKISHFSETKCKFSTSNKRDGNDIQRVSNPV